MRSTQNQLLGTARWLILFGLMVSNLDCAFAVEVGDQVRVKDGGDYRMGTVTETLGNFFRVRFDDGRQPIESLLEEQQFVSDSQFESETTARKQEERSGRFFQTLGAALGRGGVVAAVIFLWFKLRKRRQENQASLSENQSENQSDE